MDEASATGRLQAVAEWVAGAMEWWKIRIEPVLLANGKRSMAGIVYELCLPLIPDGRISLPMLRANPARAKVKRCRFNRDCVEGHIELRDNQWTCVWEGSRPAYLEDTRIMAARFVPGELVALRPHGSTLQFFRISAQTALA